MDILRGKKFHLRAAARGLAASLPITITLMAAASVASTVFFHFSSNVTNISIIFILAIILIARVTRNYGAGILASLYSVFWVNYAYTYPYMALNFTLSGYPVTFVGMALISCFTSSICIMLTRQSEQLKEQERKLMAAEKETMRANLLRAISHDLRTPLTSIIGYLELLSGGKVELSPDMEKKYLKIAYNKSKRLEQLIADLFSFTKLSYGRITMKVGYVDIVKLLSQLLEEFYPNFSEAGVSYELRSNVDSLEIAADGSLIARVFENLIGNAIKYGAEGKKVIVRVSAEPQNDAVEVKVINFGYVIPEKDLPQIFEKFYRVDQARSTKTGGTGLGLAIAKEIVEMHGGSITASSDLSGTVFCVRLKIHFNKELENFKRA